MIKKEFSKAGKVCKTTFTLPKEAVVNAKEVFLLGEFNAWNVEKPVVMKKQKDGSFATTIELESGRTYQFRYLIDQKTWENDWNADDYQPVAPFGVYNSVVFVNETLAVPAAKSNGNAAKETVKKAAVKEPVAKAPVAPKEPVAKAAAVKPVAKKVAAPVVKTVKDDLTKIEGIGPKIAELLVKDGIVTFENLAKTEVAKVKAILDKAGSKFQMHDPATWAEQAKLAAAGNWEKLAKLQDELKAGKKK
jgi:predicted flap endonuclease-1-like 5' DNA nuclease